MFVLFCLAGAAVPLLPLPVLNPDMARLASICFLLGAAVSAVGILRRATLVLAPGHFEYEAFFGGRRTVRWADVEALFISQHTHRRIGWRLRRPAPEDAVDHVVRYFTQDGDLGIAASLTTDGLLDLMEQYRRTAPGSA